VVFGLAPVTNPSSTAIFKTLSCLKSRNVLILSFARRAAAVGEAFGERIGQELRAAGWPEGLVQVVARDNSRRRTQAFFQHPGVDLILATGGPSMVRAAYASGRPALGVGAGNAPCVVLADADLDRAAAMVIASKSFDHGMVCGSEHHLVVEAAVAPAFAEALRRQGAAVLADGEAREFRDKVIQSDGLALRRKSTGQSAAALLEMAGIQRETPPPLVVLPATAEDLEAGTALAREKMAPLLSLFTAADAQDAFRIARKLLDTEGRGHTAILHSRSEETAKAFALAMPVCRVLRNCPGTHGVIGLATPLPPSLTLGCGFHGGNSVSENVTFRHLRNITHLVEPRPGFFA